MLFVLCKPIARYYIHGKMVDVVVFRAVYGNVNLVSQNIQISPFTYLYQNI